MKEECELCKGEASLYCEADAAFLCWFCDARVHGANFLVARHVRAVTCVGCRSLDAGSVSGAGSPPIRALCRSCNPDLPSIVAAASSSSSCISAEPASSEMVSRSGAAALMRQRRREAAAAGEVEAEITKWSARMGVGGARRFAEMALRVLRERGRAVADLPFRAAMAAALWAAVRKEKREGRTCERALRRLEACSGVRARIILLAVARLASAAARGRTEKEGWGECP